jgi:hypothetical protein
MHAGSFPYFKRKRKKGEGRDDGLEGSGMMDEGAEKDSESVGSNLATK